MSWFDFQIFFYYKYYECIKDCKNVIESKKQIKNKFLWESKKKYGNDKSLFLSIFLLKTILNSLEVDNYQISNKELNIIANGPLEYFMLIDENEKKKIQFLNPFIHEIFEEIIDNTISNYSYELDAIDPRIKGILFEKIVTKDIINENILGFPFTKLFLSYNI